MLSRFGAKKLVSTGVLGALDDLIVVLTKILKSGLVPVDDT